MHEDRLVARHLLPARVQCEHPRRMHPPERSDAGLVRSELRGRRILVVDDDADTREMLAIILESSGALVTTAETAGEALTWCREERPDVMISDIGLPGEDGFSLMRSVRALGTNVPAIALTGHDSEADEARSERGGFCEVLVKPVSLEIVLAAVVRALETR